MSSDLTRLARRVVGLVTRGLVGLTAHTPQGQTAQLQTAYGTREELRAQPFGISSRPLEGAEAIVLSLSPDTQVIVQVGDARYEVQTLNPGEVAVHNAYGHQVRLLQSGIVVVVGNGQFDVQQFANAPDNATFGGLVHGGGVDPYTGQTYAALGATTEQVRAEKI